MIILLVHQLSLNPNRNNFVALAWNVYHFTKIFVDATSYNQACVKPRRTEYSTILLEVLEFIFMNNVHSERWNANSVSSSVVAATTTLQNFSLDSFWSLPSNFSSSSSQASMFVLHKGSTSITSWWLPLTCCSLGVGPIIAWAPLLRKLCISGG